MADSDNMITCGENTEVEQKKVMTGAERMRKFRERQKLKDPDYSAKESDRIENIRKRRLQRNPQEERRKSRESSAAWRAKKRKKCPSTPPRRGYSTPQGLNKAVRRLQDVLPGSPNKITQTIQGLAKRHSIQLETKMKEQLQENSLTKETIELIKDYYIRSDIVYTMPGLKDEMTVWSNGTKQKLRKYYLCHYIKEVYSMFKSAYPDIKVGFSKFASLRPQNVVLLKNQPEEQCKCKTHENFCLKLKALKLEYTNEFWQSFLCDGASLEEDCWKNLCERCKNGCLFVERLGEIDESGSVVWKQWCKDEETGRIHMKYVDGCKGQLIEEICGDWEKFVQHVRVKRIQSQSFESDKTNPRVTVCQCDFAMAYSCSYQDEIQSALWSRASVNLFTVAIYQRDLPCQSLLYATDCSDKGKNSVITFMMKIAESLKGSDIGDSFILYTDGPSSEFKNRYSLKIMSEIAKILQCEVRWQYFATSHGKGVVDGIGGAAKSAVRRRVLSKSGPVVQCASDFVRVLKKDLKNVTVCEVGGEEIGVKESMWDNVPIVPGIKKVHCIAFNNGVCKLFSTNHEFTTGTPLIAEIMYERTQTEPAVSSLVVGEWVAVRYDNQTYPGEVTSVNGTHIEVSVMHPTFNQNWKWPDNPDKIFYYPYDIVKRVSPPVPVGSRGQFKFDKTSFKSH